MPRGNNIIVNANPQGRRLAGYIAAGATALNPGTLYQIDPTVATIGNLFTLKPYARSADGNRPAGSAYILDYDSKQGKIATDAYTAGLLAEFYAPQNGDEINLRFYNQSGTADDIAAGDVLIAKNNVGQFFKTTGSPQWEPAMALEAIVDPIADQLLWASWSGM
jgi:hypothetical protein